MKHIVLLILGLVPCLLHGQDDRWNVFHRTSALIQPNYPSHNLGVEFFPLAKVLSVTGEIGFIGAGSLSEQPFVHSRKYYSELRYYISEGKNRLVFGGISYQYRKAQIDDTYIIGFECRGINSRDCERYMEYSGRLSSQLHAFQLILGAKNYISDWFYFDAFFGLGLASHLLDRERINDGLLVERGRFWQENSFGPERLQFNVALKIGLVIDRFFPDKDTQPVPLGN